MDVLETVKELIKEFQEETGLDRNQFVIVVNPESPIINTEGGGVLEVINNVGVVTNERMDVDVMGLVAKYRLKELDNIITALGWDVPFDDDDVIESVPCQFCAHPVTVLASVDYENVTCPWCNGITEIE